MVGSPSRAGRALIVALVMLVSATIGSSPRAEAHNRPDFELPFPCAERWRATTYPTHGLALDWNRAGDLGDPVVAPADGVATPRSQAGGSWDHDDNPATPPIWRNPGGLGHYVEISHAGGHWKTIHAHLQEEGRASGAVKQGEVIGYVGNSGFSTGPHLHWEQRHGREEVAIVAGGESLTANTTYASRNCPGGAAPPVLVTVGDGLLLAAVSTTGTLRTRWHRPGSGWSSFARHGAADSWSTAADPATVVDADGRVWLFAVKKGGTLYSRAHTPGRGWSRPARHGQAGSWSPEAGVSATVRPNGSVTFAAVKKNGTLYHRSWTPSGGWASRFTRHGAINSWSPDTAPEIIGDQNGRLWLFAVKKNGTLYSRVHTPGSGWSRFAQHGKASSWSTKAGVSATLRPNGALTFATVKKNGTLYHRSWTPSGGWASKFTRHGAINSWSPAMAPEIIGDQDGRLWLFAVKKSGTLYSRVHTPGSGWSAFARHSKADSWSTRAGVTSAVRPSGAVTFATVKKNGTLYHRSWTPSGGWATKFTRHGATGAWVS